MATYKDLFDEAFYLAQNADVAAAVKAGTLKSGFDHYNAFGFREGRDPNALFDSSFYLLNNLDVFQGGLNPLEHYFNFGGFEGRDPSALFDSSYYIATNADVSNALINPLLHFLNFGGKEGRDPSTGFDASKYLADNPDVANAGINPLVHFIQFGQAEGRSAFDTFGNQVTGEPGIPEQGQSSTLTLDAGANNLSGTAGNDTGSAPIVVTPNGNIIASLQSTDTVNFGDGFDVFRVTLNGEAEDGAAPGPRPTLLGLERMEFTTINGVTGNKSNFDAGATQFSGSEIGTVRAGTFLTVNNIGASGGTTPNVFATDDIGGAGADYFFANSVVSGTADAITLTLTNTGPGNNVGAIRAQGQTAGGFETVNFVTAGTAASRLTDFAQGSTITTAANYSGSQNLTITNELENIITHTSTAFTGTLSVVVDDNKNIVFTGGAGVDIVNFGTGGTIQDIFDGGDGRDRLIAADNNLFQTGNQISNVEIGEVRTEGTYDFSKIASLDQAVINDAAGGVDDYVIDMFPKAGASDSTKGVTIQDTAGGDVDNVTINVAGAGDAGSTNDSLFVTLGAAATAAAAANGVAVTDITAADIEALTVNVAAGASSTVNDLILDAATSLFFTGGSASTTLAIASNLGDDGAALTNIDGSAFLGALTITGADLDGATAGSSQAIKGGAGGDTITFGGDATGGDAAGGGAEVVTGNGGNDNFAFATSAAGSNDQSSTLTNVAMDRITDLNFGGSNAASRVDQVSVNADAAAATTIVSGGAIETIFGANLAAALTTLFTSGTLSTDSGAGNGSVGLFGFGTDTYLAGSSVASNNGFDIGADFVVRVTGVTGTLDASDVFIV